MGQMLEPEDYAIVFAPLRRVYMCVTVLGMAVLKQWKGVSNFCNMRPMVP